MKMSFSPQTFGSALLPRSVTVPEEVQETAWAIEIFHQPDVRLHAVGGGEKALAVRMQAEAPIPEVALIVGQVEPRLGWPRSAILPSLLLAATVGHDARAGVP